MPPKNLEQKPGDDRPIFIQDSLRSIVKHFQEQLTLDNKYWIDAGTLLGLRRNGAFIPWDDDADIGMLREDFAEIAHRLKDLDQCRFKYHLPNTNTFVPVNFDSIKVRDSWTIGFEAGYTQQNVPAAYSGICLDIVPFDPAPVTFFFPLVVVLAKIHSRFRLRVFSGQIEVGLASRTVYEISKAILDLVIMLAPKSKKFIVPSWYGNYPRRKHKIDDIFPTVSSSFEGLKLEAPNDADAYLSQLYGRDFMRVPPMQERKSHFIKIDTTPEWVTKRDV